MASIRARTLVDGTTVWQVRWRQGGRHSKLESATCPTEQAALKVKAIVEALGHLPVEALAPQAAAEPTFAQLVDQHIDQMTGVTPRTRSDARRDARNHFQPLWDLPASLVTRAAVTGLINGWEDAGVRSKTIANWRGLLSSVCKTAVRNGHLDANPCDGIRRSRWDEHEIEDLRILTPQEYAVLLSEIPAPHRLLVEVLARTGIRWGEAVGLEVQDVDLFRRVLRIRRAQKRDGRGGFYIGPVKTRASRRDITLSPALAAMLRPLVSGRALEEPLFANSVGRRISHSNVYNRVWRPAVARAMDRERHGAAAIAHQVRIHDLRHCHASWLIAEGVDMLVVQRRLGHESITTTIDRYSHLLPEQQAGAADAIDRALSAQPAETAPATATSDDPATQGPPAALADRRAVG